MSTWTVGRSRIWTDEGAELVGGTKPGVDAHALTSSATTTRLATRTGTRLTVCLCLALPAYGSMMVVAQSTVLSGAIAKRLAEDVLADSGSTASA
jgi:hypothetical protein